VTKLKIRANTDDSCVILC